MLINDTALETIRHEGPGGAYWTARELWKPLGYARWQNFHGVVQRANHLIRQGFYPGSIRPAPINITLGYDAVRSLPDYQLDRAAVETVCLVASAHKLTGTPTVRNEAVMLQLLHKYCTSKGLTFEFQYQQGGYRYDACVAGRLLIEFDEPHHANITRQRTTDAAKDATASARGMRVLRFTLADDIIDMILTVEGALRYE